MALFQYMGKGHFFESVGHSLKMARNAGLSLKLVVAATGGRIGGNSFYARNREVAA